MAQLYQPTQHGLTPKAYSAIQGDGVHLSFRREGSGILEDAFAVLSVDEARATAASLIAAADEADAMRARLVEREAAAAAAEQAAA